MARVIHSSFRQWMLEEIEETGYVMIRSRQRSYTTSELYPALVPDALVRGTLKMASEYLQPRETQGFDHKIMTHFSNGFKINMPYRIYFQDMENSIYNHILLPWECDPITIDSPLGRDLLPLATTAIEWSILHFVTDHILTNIASDSRAISNIFPWVKSLINGSTWARERTRFRHRHGLDTKGAQEACDLTFNAALGEPMNVPPLTDVITKAALSGNRLFSQARMLINTPGFSDKSFINKTTIAPYITRYNVPPLIEKHIKDIEEFVEKRKKK
jgi:hypothetical protein